MFQHSRDIFFNYSILSADESSALTFQQNFVTIQLHCIKIRVLNHKGFNSIVHFQKELKDTKVASFFVLVSKSSDEMVSVECTNQRNKPHFAPFSQYHKHGLRTYKG